MSRPVLSLYKKMLREANELSSYNFKMYSLRRIKDAFKENKYVNNPEEISDLIKFGETNLLIMQRQGKIGKMYTTDKLVIEK